MLRSVLAPIHPDGWRFIAAAVLAALLLFWLGVAPLGWLDRDGKVLKWVSGYAAWTGILREYGNYVYPNPQLLGRIQNLFVDTVYLS